jgi:hypothetical protein
MNKKQILHLVAVALIFGTCEVASAHIGYTGRNFGSFDANGLESPVSLTSSTQSYGWADGTDADFGDSHRVRAFRFTLQNVGWVTISIQATGVGSPFLPGFSIYSGLAHISPDTADHDANQSTLDYLATLGGSYEGAYRSLSDWKVGNTDRTTEGAFYPASLSNFTYIGNAADGSSANYGSAAGINGDGIADGFVTATFWLDAGEYSMFVGGADYADQSNAGTYGFTATVNAVPEPSTVILLGAAAGVLLFRLLKRKEPNQNSALV